MPRKHGQLHSSGMELDYKWTGRVDSRFDGQDFDSNTIGMPPIDANRTTYTLPPRARQRIEARSIKLEVPIP